MMQMFESGTFDIAHLDPWLRRWPSPQSDAMNEKTPNLQFQAAMKEARAMAIKRVPELAESAVGVESFPIGHKASVDDETRTVSPRYTTRWEDFYLRSRHIEKGEYQFGTRLSA